MTKVKTRIWKFHNNTNFYYPEDDIASVANIGSNYNTFSLAISGGGTRSASCTIGYLAGLKKCGLLHKIKYISAVSGGAWAAIPFTFLPQPFEEDAFLGKYLPPNMLSEPQLTRVNRKSFPYTLSKSVIITKAIKEWLSLSGDETYARSLGGNISRPYNLHNINSFFSHDQQTLDECLEKNPDLNPTQFILARPKRPFLITTATILDHEFLAPSNKFQVEFTPYYAGVRVYHASNEPVGGGYINTYAYDSREPRGQEDEQTSEATVKISGRLWRTNEFSLSDMMGSTGAAPQESTDKFMLRHIGFPEFRHWSIIADEQGRYENDNEFSHSDGGHLENLGIMPLLARGVKKIIILVNSKTPFQYNDTNPAESKLASSIRNLFLPCPSYHQTDTLFSNNIVLHGGEESFQKIIATFREQEEAGEPLVHVDNYQVLDNHFYGIKAYDQAQIIWIYNHRVTKWEDELHNDYQTQIGEPGKFRHFPNYLTFAENFPFLIDLCVEQTGLLSNLCQWIITDQQQTIRTHFSLEE